MVPDGVRLVPVGDDELPSRRPDRVVDDEAGVRHLGGVRRLGADAVLRGDKAAVPGVPAPAHDEVRGNGKFAVRASAQDDAPPGIGVASQPFQKVSFFHIHPPQLKFHSRKSRRFLSRQSGRYCSSRA